MEFLQQAIKEWALYIDIVGIILILTIKFFSNTKASWAAVGFTLIIIALGNAAVMLSVGLKPNEILASLFGLAVLGSLGVRFLSNWLTDGAT